MPGMKTNELPGTRAVLRHYRMSAYKARQVLDLIRDKDAETADEILRTTPREAARVVSKVLNSALANARHNDGLDPEELYVAACYADEGSTLKRWRPRARGRATRIRKRTCHITVIVARLPEERLERQRARRSAGAGASRARRVAASRETTEQAETASESGNRATRRARARGELVDEPEEAESGEAESADAESADAESEEAESGKADSEEAESGKADSEEAESEEPTDESSAVGETDEDVEVADTETPDVADSAVAGDQQQDEVDEDVDEEPGQAEGSTEEKD